jgi:hypothetical protein
MTPEQIKAIANILLGIALIASGWVYGAWQKHELTVYQENQAQQIAKNEQLKTEKEKQDDADKAYIADSYNSDLGALRKRLRELEALPRGADMPVASTIGDRGAVPQEALAPGGINAPPRTIQRLPYRDGFYSDALEVELQAEKLQDYILRVCQ